MSKIFMKSIERCQDCPAFDVDVSGCEMMDYREIETKIWLNGIPDWCPLPDEKMEETWKIRL